MREKLIAAGVRNLKDMGYVMATRNNILTDAIYASFFKVMLNNTIVSNPEYKTAVLQLLSELKGFA